MTEAVDFVNFIEKWSSSGIKYVKLNLLLGSLTGDLVSLNLYGSIR